VKASKLVLTPNEQVLHPNPYVEQEYNPVIVTTRRVIYAPVGKKKKEIPADKIHFSGKGFHQQFIVLMVIFALLGAPFLLIGGLKYYSYKDKPTEPPAKVEGMPQKPLTKQDAEMYANNKQQQIIGIVLGIFGAAFGVVAFLLYKRRLTAIIAGGGKAIAIPVKDKATQDKLLMMVGAAQQSAKAMAVQAIPSKVQRPGGPPPKLGK